MGRNNTLNQVIRLAFTSDPMKSGKYEVLSGSRSFTFLANVTSHFGQRHAQSRLNCRAGALV